MKFFWALNKRTKQFKSILTEYNYTKKITTKAKDTIIINSKCENIHPVFWKKDWFEDEKEAEEYINKLKGGGYGK